LFLNDLPSLEINSGARGIFFCGVKKLEITNSN
jgi:hypothetical protein